MKTIVHVNQHIIKFNAKHETTLPTLTIKRGKETIYAHEVTGEGARVVDANAQGRNPLSCGARVWMEFDGPIQVIGEETNFEQIKEAMSNAGN